MTQSRHGTGIRCGGPAKGDRDILPVPPYHLRRPML
jgi:hypothetical protein